jgi:hypothetical protein
LIAVSVVDDLGSAAGFQVLWDTPWSESLFEADAVLAVIERLVGRVEAADGR